MKFIKYWYWRKYKYIPHKDEVFQLYCIVNPESKENYRSTTGLFIVQTYMLGLSIESTAKHYNVTRERVRQMVWKYYRKWKRSK